MENRKPKPFRLTEANYHSRAARQRWFSSSDIKAAKRCEAGWLAEYRGKTPRPQSSAFLFGHVFEAALTLPATEWVAWLGSHQEVRSSRGPTKGLLRSEFAPAVEMASAVRRSPYLRGVVQRSKKQVILTGTLHGLPMRVMMDLLDRDGSIYDIKSTRDFRPIYDANREEYIDWWAYWNYPMQLYIYREIARQNGVNVPRVGLIAASKVDCDVQALTFGQEVMEAAAADVDYTMQRMRAILAGEEEPQSCERCPWCLRHKKITRFEEV